MTVIQDIKRLAPASEQLGIADIQLFKTELSALLSPSTWSDTNGHTALNSNGSPIELCVSAKGNKIRGRLLVDPCHVMRGGERFNAAWDSALKLAASRAPELIHSLQTTHNLITEWCSPDQFPHGPLWLASVPGGLGMALYCDPQPFHNQANHYINEWLKAVAPKSRNYFETLLQHTDDWRLSSFGIEGYRVDDARVKIYFRLTTESSRLRSIGVAELYSPPIIEWLTKAIPNGAIHPEGLVLSISAPLNGEGDTDAKADICGHCVGHSLTAWDDIFSEIEAAKTLPRFSEYLNDSEISIAFAGLGVTSGMETRVNVYLRAER